MLRVVYVGFRHHGFGRGSTFTESGDVVVCVQCVVQQDTTYPPLLMGVVATDSDGASSGAEVELIAASTPRHRCRTQQHLRAQHDQLRHRIKKLRVRFTRDTRLLTRPDVHAPIRTGGD